jgi:hypothetical protein
MNKPKQEIVVDDVAPGLRSRPANATTYPYTYDFNFSVGSTAVTGNLMTDIDSGNLAQSDYGPWSITMGGNTYSSATGGTVSAITNYVFVVSPTELTFDGTQNGRTAFNEGTWELQFTGGLINWFLGSTEQTEQDEDGDSAFLLGDMATTSATPLPAALPLFGTVLGVGGLLGWRSKRKNAIAAA